MSNTSVTSGWSGETGACIEDERIMDGTPAFNFIAVAFNFIAKQGHCMLFRMVVNTYELLRYRELFISKVREFLARNQYKEAGQIAADPELFYEHDFVMPPFLQDKISIAEDYLNKAERLQRPVM